jgi:hypothetical protein
MIMMNEEENNMDVEIELEEGKPKFEISSSILHILDYSAHTTVLSEASLNLEDSLIGKLVMRLVRRVHRDMDARQGTFAEESDFMKLVDRCSRDEISFTAFSQQAAAMFDAVLGEQSVKTIDLFVNAYHYDDVPYMSFLFLEGQSSLAPYSGQENGLRINTIQEKRGILPSLGRKIPSYAVINCLNHEVRMRDEMKWDTEDKNVLSSVMGCSASYSQKEVITSLTDIADEVAQAFDDNPALSVSRIKQRIDETAREERPLAAEELAEAAFPGEENRSRQEAFMKKAKEESLPETVAVEPGVLRARMKKQKITTDTGIEISFPTEYSANPDMISFVDEEDGSISISIRHISKITNKS